MKVTDKKIDFITLDLGKYEEKDLMRVLFDTVEKASEEMVFITTPEFAQAGMKYMQKLASFDEQGVDMILPQNFDGHILMLGAIYKKSSLISISNLLAEGESNIEELIYESWAKVVTARELENLGDLLPMDSTKGILSRYLGRSSAADPGSSNNVGEGLILQLLPWNFSVCKIEAEQEIPLAQDYFFTGKTKEEYSLVCPTDQIPVQTLEREDGWRGFRIKDILEFSLIGILAPIAKILADHRIGIFVISTFNTDYVFVKEEDYNRAVSLLEDAGYGIETLKMM